MHSMGLNEQKEVKAKSLKALEKLGHTNLKLDEYESVCLLGFPRNEWGFLLPQTASCRSDCVRSYTSR